MNRSASFLHGFAALMRWALLAVAALWLGAACTTGRTVSSTSTPAASPSKLAYVQGGDIWVITLPHGQPQRITTSGQAGSPRWSPSGEWLAFDDGASEWIARADGTDARKVDDFFAWSPVDDRFVGVDKGGAIYVDNADGSGYRVVVPPPQPIGGTKVQLGGLTWSSDGHQLAYTMLATATSGTPPDRASSLWSVRVDGGQATKVYDVGSPARDGIVLYGWSPGRDALFVAFDPSFSASAGADGFPLQAVRADPGATPRLTPFVPRPATVFPRAEFWAAQPGRSGIAVTDVTDGGRYTWTGKCIALVSVGSGTVKDLTPSDVAAIEPAWSPDGQRIAYAAAPDAGTGVSGGDAAKAAMALRRIWVMDADGSNQHQLTNNPAYRDERPQWLDGGSILFVRLDANDRASLWLVPAAGGTPTRVVDSLSPVAAFDAPVWFGYYGYIGWDAMFALWSPPSAASVPTPAGVANPKLTVVAGLAPAQAEDFIARVVTRSHPLLFPSAIPETWSVEVSGLSDATGFMARFTSPDRAKSVRLALVAANPGEPGASTVQSEPNFHGDARSVYQVQDKNDPASFRWLLWDEPGVWGGGPASSGTPYYLDATGLTDAEFWRVADSLHPIQR